MEFRVSSPIQLEQNAFAPGVLKTRGIDGVSYVDRRWGGEQYISTSYTGNRCGGGGSSFYRLQARCVLPLWYNMMPVFRFAIKLFTLVYIYLVYMRHGQELFLFADVIPPRADGMTYQVYRSQPNQTFLSVFQVFFFFLFALCAALGGGCVTRDWTEM